MKTKDKVLLITGLIALLILFTFLGVKAQDLATIQHKAYTTTFSKSKGYPVKVEWWVTRASIECAVKAKQTHYYLLNAYTYWLIKNERRELDSPGKLDKLIELLIEDPSDFETKAKALLN